MISPPCAVVLLRFPSLVVKVPVALLGNGVTVTLTDMELFSSRTVELSAVAQATTTPEDMRGIIPSPSNGTANEGATGGLGGGGLTQDDEGRAGGQHDGPPSRCVESKRCGVEGASSSWTRQAAVGSEVNRGEAEQPRAGWLTAEGYSTSAARGNNAVASL